MNKYFQSLVEELRQWISQNSQTKILYLEGDLGAGKTQLTKELLDSYSFNPDQVQSPTFLKMLEYDVEGLGKVLHLDCYRMEEASDLENLGLEHYIDQVALIVVEWPKLFKDYSKTSGLDKLWFNSCAQKTLTISR